MKKVIYALVVVYVMLSVSYSIGCDTSSSNNELEHMPKWAIDMMQLIPANVPIVTFCDIGTIRANTFLQNYYASQMTVYEFITDLAMFVDFDQVDYWTIAGSGLCLVKGSFNLADIKESLGNNGWVSDRYEGVEIWTNEELEGNLVALFNGYIIMGPEEAVTEAIETFNGDHPSLYEDQQFRDLMMRLPSGFDITYVENDFDITLAPSEIIYVGTTVDILESNTARVVKVATAMNRDITEDYMQNIMKDAEQDEEYDQLDISINRDGEYITLTVVCPVSVIFD